MPRRIEYEGRIIEVPDDATDDEVATIIEASGQSAAEVPPDLYERRSINPILVGRERDPGPPSTDSFIGGVGEQLGLTMPAIKQHAGRVSGYSLVDAIRKGQWGRVPEEATRFLFPPAGMAVDLASEAVRSPAAQGTRIGEELGELEAGRGSKTVLAGHVAATAVPVIGGQIGDIGEMYETEPKRAAGRTTSLIAPMLVGQLKGRKPEFPAGQVRKTVAERTGKFERIERLTERSIVGSKAFREFRIAALDDMRKLTEDTAARISKYRGDPEALGVELRTSLTKMRANTAKHTAALEAEVNQAAIPKRRRMNVRDAEGNVLDTMTDRVNQKYPRKSASVADPATGAWVDIAPWQRYVAELRKVADDPHGFRGRLRPTELAEIEGLLSELKASPRMLPWDTAQRAAQTIRKYVRDDVDINPSLGGRTTSRLDATLDAAMEDALVATGGPELAGKWRAVQQLREESNAAFLDGVVKRMAAEKPEAMHAFMMDSRVSFADARMLADRLPVAQRRAIASANLVEAVRKSVTTIRQKGGVRDVLNAHKLAKELDDRLADGKLDLLVDDARTMNEIRELVREARTMEQPPEIDVNALDPGNQQLNIGKMMRGDFTTEAVGTVAGLAGVTRLMLSPAPWVSVRNALGMTGRGATAQAVTSGAQSAADREQQRKAASGSMRDWLQNPEHPDRQSKPQSKSALPPVPVPTLEPATQQREKNQATEWPADPNARDENDALFVDRSMESSFPPAVNIQKLVAALPPHFKNARKAAFGAPLSGRITTPTGENVVGVYGSAFDKKDQTIPDKRRPQYMEESNTVKIDPRANDSPGIWTHEVGHAVWDKDLTEEQRHEWVKYHNTAFRDAIDRVKSAGITATSAGGAVLKAAAAPRAVLYYGQKFRDNSYARYSESFAEMFNQYLMNPTAFKETYPGFYGYFKRVFRGKEYTQKPGNGLGDRSAVIPSTQSVKVGGSESKQNTSNEISPEEYWREFNPYYGVGYEGAALLNEVAPADLLPDRFKHAKATVLGQEMSQGTIVHGGAGVQGVYGEPWTVEDRKSYHPFLSRLANWDKPEGYGEFPTVTLAREIDQASYPLVLMHEYGHAAWRGGDVTVDEKKEWAKVHEERLRSGSEGSSIPRSIRYYADDPGHSFADMFGLFVVAPTEFKARYPEEYGFFRRMFGREYVVQAGAANRLKKLREAGGDK